MSAETERFKELWADRSTRGDAEEYAIEVVNAHPEWFGSLEGKTQEQVVALVSFYRGNDMEEDSVLATMFEMAKWERQQIGGGFEARLRLKKGN